MGFLGDMFKTIGGVVGDNMWVATILKGSSSAELAEATFRRELPDQDRGGVGMRLEQIILSGDTMGYSTSQRDLASRLLKIAKPNSKLLP